MAKEILDKPVSPYLLGVDWARQDIGDITAYMQIPIYREETSYGQLIANEGEEAQPDIPYEVTVIDVQGVLAFIQKEVFRLDKMGYEVDFVLFGEEEFARVAKCAYRHHVYGFEIREGYRWKDQRVLGVRIRVSPTIRGWAVIPKER